MYVTFHRVNYRMKPMKPPEFEISVLFVSYNKTTAKTCRNCYDSEKRIVLTVSKVFDPKI